MSSKSLFVTGSFVFLKEALYPFFVHQFRFLYFRHLLVSQVLQYSLLCYTLEIFPYSLFSILLFFNLHPFSGQLFLSMASLLPCYPASYRNSLLELFVLDWNFYQLALK